MSRDNLYFLKFFSGGKIITQKEPMGNRASPWCTADILSHLYHCLKKEIKVEHQGEALKM